MVITFIDYGQLDHVKSSSEIRELVYYNFWNMELDEMIDKLGES